jgi:hypothetical protein
MLLYYRHGKYMACCLLYRGDVVPKVTGMLTQFSKIPCLLKVQSQEIEKCIIKVFMGVRHLFLIMIFQNFLLILYNFHFCLLTMNINVNCICL